MHRSFASFRMTTEKRWSAFAEDNGDVAGSSDELAMMRGQAGADDDH